MASTVTCDACGATKPRNAMEFALSRMGPLLIGDAPTIDACDAACLLAWAKAETARVAQRQHPAPAAEGGPHE